QDVLVAVVTQAVADAGNEVLETVVANGVVETGQDVLAAAGADHVVLAGYQVLVAVVEYRVVIAANDVLVAVVAHGVVVADDQVEIRTGSSAVVVADEGVVAGGIAVGSTDDVHRDGDTAGQRYQPGCRQHGGDPREPRAGAASGVHEAARVGAARGRAHRRSGAGSSRAVDRIAGGRGFLWHRRDTPLSSIAHATRAVRHPHPVP